MDRNGRSGINILEPETGQLSLLEHIPGRDNYSLPANSILSLYNDRNQQYMGRKYPERTGSASAKCQW